MNRLICPECDQPSYCASLSGPVHCANEDCGALLLPGTDLEVSTDRRALPRFTADSVITVEYLDEDRRVVERERPFLDVSVIAFSTILREYPALGSRLVVELGGDDADSTPWRVQGIVREVRPADDEGFRVGIKVCAQKPEEGDS